MLAAAFLCGTESCLRSQSAFQAACRLRLSANWLSGTSFAPSRFMCTFLYRTGMMSRD